MPKSAKNFECEKCNFICSKQSNFNLHLTTAKHIRLINANSSLLENMPTEYKCICGNEYKHASSLSKHKKGCPYTPPSSHEENIQTTIEPIEPNSSELLVLVKELMIQMAVKNKHQDELMLQMAAKDKQQDELIKQNMELQNTMRELIPHIGNNNNKKIYKKVLPEIKLDKPPAS